MGNPNPGAENRTFRGQFFLQHSPPSSPHGLNHSSKSVFSDPSGGGAGAPAADHSNATAFFSRSLRMAHSITRITSRASSWATGTGRFESIASAFCSYTEEYATGRVSL